MNSISDETPLRMFTQSELGTFRKCRRRWWLGNIVRIRLKPEYRKEYAASLGSLMHGGFEYQDTTGDHWSTALDASEWIEAELWSEDAELLKESTDRHRTARIIMEGYDIWLENTGADQFYEMISAEEKVSVPFPDVPGTGLLGKIDKRVRHTETGKQSFIDYKKTGDLTNIPKYAEQDEQFLHYTLLLNLAYPEDEVYSGIWRMMMDSKRTDRSLRKDGSEKEFFGEHEKTFNEHQIASYRTRLAGIINDILEVEEKLRSGVDPLSVVYPKPSRDWGGCGQCEFFALCPMYDDGSRVDAFINEYYEQGDPLERYRTVTSTVVE